MLTASQRILLDRRLDLIELAVACGMSGADLTELATFTHAQCDGLEADIALRVKRLFASC